MIKVRQGKSHLKPTPKCLLLLQGLEGVLVPGAAQEAQGAAASPACRPSRNPQTMRLQAAQEVAEAK